MVEIKKLRRQLTNEVNLLLPRLQLELQHLEPPNDETCLLLRQIILSGMVNQVARKVTILYRCIACRNCERRMFLQVAQVAGQGTPKELALAYECDDIEDPVHLHGKGLFAVRSKREKLPEWVVYQEVT